MLRTVVDLYENFYAYLGVIKRAPVGLFVKFQSWKWATFRMSNHESVLAIKIFIPAQIWSNLTFSYSNNFPKIFVSQLKQNFEPSVFVKRMKLNRLLIFTKNDFIQSRDSQTKSRTTDLPPTEYSLFLWYFIPMVFQSKAIFDYLTA